MMFGIVVEYVDSTDVMPLSYETLEDAMAVRDEYVKTFRTYKSEDALRVYVIAGERVAV